MEKIHLRKVADDYDKAGNILRSDNSHQEAVWKQAFKEKIFLFKDTKNIQSDIVDYATFELIIATTFFTKEDKLNTLNMLKAFWRSLWPYIWNLASGYYELQTSWHGIVYDQNETLKNYADQNLELKIYKEFLANTTDGIQKSFNEYKEKREREIEEQLEEIRKKASSKESQEPIQ